MDRDKICWTKTLIGILMPPKTYPSFWSFRWDIGNGGVCDVVKSVLERLEDDGMGHVAGRWDAIPLDLQLAADHGKIALSKGLVVENNLGCSTVWMRTNNAGYMCGLIRINMFLTIMSQSLFILIINCSSYIM